MFSERLKELRKEKRITQEQLAAIIGVERSSIGKYEGKSHIIPSDDVKYRIAEYFGVTVDYLMGYSDNPHPHSGNISLTDEESELVTIYRSLNAAGRNMVLHIARVCAGNPDMQKEDGNTVTA